MKGILFTLLMTVIMVSCGPQPQAVYVQSPPAVVQPAVVQSEGYSPYQVYDNGAGGQVVYYTDPYLHTSYYLEYAMFMSLLNSGGYGGIHNYYMGHRSYVDRNYTTYHNTYHHVYYDSRSDGGARYRRSVPNNPSASTRQSVPSGRSAYTPSTSSSTTRSSVPTGRSNAPTYTPSRSSVPSGRSSSSSPNSSSSSRRSMPSGRH